MNDISRVIVFHQAHAADKQNSGDPAHTVMADLLNENAFKSHQEYSEWAQEKGIDYVDQEKWENYTDLPLQ